MRYLLKSLIFVVALALIGSCVRDEPRQELADTGLPEGFNDFYVQFHRDTAFQMSHISWPLAGIKGGLSPDTSDGWSRSEWQPHTRIPSSLEYDQTFNVLSSDLVVETIRDRQSRHAMQRRFARMSDGWYLIYYVEMQPIRSAEPN